MGFADFMSRQKKDAWGERLRQLSQKEASSLTQKELNELNKQFEQVTHFIGIIADTCDFDWNIVDFKQIFNQALAQCKKRAFRSRDAPLVVEDQQGLISDDEDDMEPSATGGQLGEGEPAEPLSHLAPSHSVVDYLFNVNQTFTTEDLIRRLGVPKSSNDAKQVTRSGFKVTLNTTSLLDLTDLNMFVMKALLPTSSQQMMMAAKMHWLGGFFVVVRDNNHMV